MTTTCVAPAVCLYALPVMLHALAFFLKKVLLKSTTTGIWCWRVHVWEERTPVFSPGLFGDLSRVPSSSPPNTMGLSEHKLDS